MVCGTQLASSHIHCWQQQHAPGCRLLPPPPHCTAADSLPTHSAATGSVTSCVVFTFLPAAVCTQHKATCVDVGVHHIDMQGGRQSVHDRLAGTAMPHTVPSRPPNRTRLLKTVLVTQCESKTAYDGSKTTNASASQGVTGVSASSPKAACLFTKKSTQHGAATHEPAVCCTRRGYSALDKPQHSSGQAPSQIITLVVRLASSRSAGELSTGVQFCSDQQTCGQVTTACRRLRRDEKREQLAL